MEMRKCEKGHYYDASVHATCPYCNNLRNTEMTMAMGVPMPSQLAGSLAPGAVATESGLEKTVALGVEIPTQGVSVEDSEKTVAMFKTEEGIDPVVGWLVQISGKQKGCDYRIHSDNNYIGRGDKMDICIKGDDTISRENHAVLTYDSYDKKFFFSPGDGRSIIRVNDKTILQTIELKAYDKLLVGKSEMIFIPFCGESFEWDKES